MLKALGSGAAFFFILALVAVLGTDAEWLINYSFTVGIGCLVLAILFGGVDFPTVWHREPICEVMIPGKTGVGETVGRFICF